VTATPHIPADLLARAQTVVGLRQLADYLEDHPDVPVREYGWDLNIYVTADTDEAGRAEVDQIAAVLDATPIDDTLDGGHYWTRKTFGRISYRAVYIPARAWARHRAENSYRRNISIGLDHAGQKDEKRDGMRDEAA
jgi:hypothetical protein